MVDTDTGRVADVEDEHPDWRLTTVWIEAEHIHVPDLDQRLFGNDLSFNGVQIHLRTPVTFTGLTDALTLTAATSYGLVLTCDRFGRHEGDGFHSHLIPWSNIVWIHQYIAT